MSRRPKTLLLAALAFVAVVMLPAGRYLFWGRERITLASVSPDGSALVRLVELPSFIDRNFELRLVTIKEGTEQGAATTVFRSPDEGRPAGSERIVWSKDSSVFLLLGRHFYVTDEAKLPNGEMLYLFYDLRSGKTLCNATQQSQYPSFTVKELGSVEWVGR